MSVRPDKNKSIFENYYNHLCFFYKTRRKTEVCELLSQWLAAGIGKDSDNYCTHTIATAIALRPMVPFTRLRIHRALHDVYDYVDEILAATIVPPLLVLASCYLLMRAIFDFVSSHGKSYHHGFFDLMNVGLGIFLAIFSLMKASLSLLIRPLLTLGGWRTDEDPRFCSGINDKEDFRVGYLHKSTNPYLFYPASSSMDKLERAWHQHIRPRLGFGNL